MLTVVKIGGNVIDDTAALEKFLDAFSRLESPKLLVHGGGKLATRLATQLGIPTTMIEGRRVTDAETLRIATMVYAGLTNKNIVASLAAKGTAAIGLCGADANVIRSEKRPAKPIDYGFVGDIVPDGVNTSFIASLFSQNITPIFCAITHDGGGQLLNTNADSVASALAQALAQTMPTRLVYCFEKKGVLSSVDNENSVIAHIDRPTFDKLRADGTISAGMLPKITGALAAVENGVERVIIKHADDLLLPDAGTHIY